VGSLAGESIVCTTLSILSRIQRFQWKQVGKWVFVGPAEFVQLVDEARQRLEIEDPGLLNSMTIPYKVIYSPKGLFSFPLWRYGGVSDGFTIWKSEGVLAAWIYFYYHSLQATKGRWFLSDRQNSTGANKEAKANTRDWLMSHEFPEELSEAFA
jgi:hypothetical protein